VPAQQPSDIQVWEDSVIVALVDAHPERPRAGHPLSDWDVQVIRRHIDRYPPRPPPEKDKRGRLRYSTTRKEGIHQLRPYYASVMLAAGVSIKELAEYLGHADPAFTLRVYAHLLSSSHDRARADINEHFTRMSIDPGSPDA
jgi:integrase